MFNPKSTRHNVIFTKSLDSKDCWTWLCNQKNVRASIDVAVRKIIPKYGTGDLREAMLEQAINGSSNQQTNDVRRCNSPQHKTVEDNQQPSAAPNIHHDNNDNGSSANNYHNHDDTMYVNLSSLQSANDSHKSSKKHKKKTNKSSKKIKMNRSDRENLKRQLL